MKKLNVSFPLGVFTVVTGVSGSGKSSLVVDVLQRALEKELNGKQVRSLKHLLEMIEEMPQHTSYLVFESEWDPLPVVLDYQQSLREHERILRLYGIYSDRRFHAEKEPAG